VKVSGPKNVHPIIAFRPDVLPACQHTVCISIPPRTLLAPTSHVISVFCKAMQSCRQTVTECHKQTTITFLLFLLKQNNELMLRSRHVVIVITRRQPVTFYPELFMSSDSDFNTINAEIKLQQSGGTTRALQVVYVHYYCNVMCFET